MYTASRLTMALAYTCGLVAQTPSVADLIEKRLPEPQSVGTRPLAVGSEIAAPVPFPSIHALRDGKLMMIGSGKAAYSSDGGNTWSAPEKLTAPVDYVVTLQSGKIGGPVPEKPAANASVAQGDLFFHVSGDEGKTWERRGRITVSREAGWPYPKTMIQMKSGRLVLPVRYTDGAGHMGLYDASRSWGTLNGKLVPIEGHAHWPEPDIAFAFYSDDEGRTWQRSEGGITIWHKEGYGGMWPCDEPSIVETKNAHLLLFCRTTLGRIYTSHSGPSEQSKPNGEVLRFSAGQRFDLPQPTPLASSYSPPTVARIPKTGDILAVWNQVSGDEIRAGYRRGRLSSAISKDDGKTWRHFRTIDTAVLPPAGRVEPDAEPQMARGLDYVGVLPEDYGGVDYATLAFVEESVFVYFKRTVVNVRPGDVTGARLRKLPLSWFYGDEPPAAEAPGLVLRVPAGDRFRDVEIEARYHEDRFFCHSRDVERHLRASVGRLEKNLFGPLHQIVTMLGWSASYDRSHMKDASNPRLIVTVAPPRER
ncbi:MAG: exo-alpha-sialidase [Acidobacteria bacterium]|nr:exo-alpha-sialidase [Acidobacteriota bacterium]